MKWLVPAQILLTLWLAGPSHAADSENTGLLAEHKYTRVTDPQERSLIFCAQAEEEYLESHYAEAYQYACQAVDTDAGNISAQQLKEKLHLVLEMAAIPEYAAQAVTPTAQPVPEPVESTLTGGRRP